MKQLAVQPEWERNDAEHGVSDARNRLTGLLDEVEAGCEIVITRRGKPVAHLVPAGAFDRVKARRVAAGLRLASNGRTLGDLSIRDLVDQGRR